MPKDTGCPEIADLQRLLLGQIPDPSAEPLDAHLLQCGRCATLANALPAADPLLDGIRVSAAAPPHPESGVIEDLVVRLQGLRHLTCAPDPAETGSPSLATPAPQGATLPPALADEARALS